MRLSAALISALWSWLMVLSAFAQQPIQLVDATARSGIDFVHEDGADLEGYLVSIMGSGLGLLDYDNDGLIDAYFLNGKNFRPNRSGADDPAECNALFRNLGAGRFVRVSPESSTALSVFSLGVATADFDNDGFVDVAISNFGSCALLRNNGDGTFSDVTAQSGLDQTEIAFGAGIAFLDVQNDGNLDLYIADYVDFSFDRYHALAPTLFPYPPGPEHFEHRPDQLFHNDGDGRFTNISERAGIAAYKSPSMGVVCGDFDQDGDADIFVCADARPNLYFVNDGTGVFSQDAELFAVAYNASGIPVGSMGAEAGDVSNDGLEDLFITDYSAQMPILFRNLGEFGFEDTTAISRSGRDAVPHANWGAGLVDFDNDGDRDLMIGNGHLLKNAKQIEQLTDFKVQNFLLANNGHGVFENVTQFAGSGLEIIESTRGLAFDDMDNDGDVDCLVLNCDASANYLENRSRSGNWIQFTLSGNRFNRSGVGARVTVVSGELQQTAEMRSGRGYQSSYGCRLHFGLGPRTAIDRVSVNWGSKVQVYEGLEINRIHRLEEARD